MKQYTFPQFKVPRKNLTKKELLEYYDLPNLWKQMLERNEYMCIVNVLSHPKIVKPSIVREIACRIITETPISENSCTLDLLVLDEYKKPIEVAMLYTKGMASKSELSKAFLAYANLPKLIQTRLSVCSMNIADMLDRPININEELIATANMIRAAYLTCVRDSTMNLAFGDIVTSVNTAVEYTTKHKESALPGVPTDSDLRAMNAHADIIAEYDITFK